MPDRIKVVWPRKPGLPQCETVFEATPERLLSAMREIRMEAGSALQRGRTLNKDSVKEALHYHFVRGEFAREMLKRHGADLKAVGLDIKRTLDSLAKIQKWIEELSGFDHRDLKMIVLAEAACERWLRKTKGEPAENLYAEKPAWLAPNLPSSLEDLAKFLDENGECTASQINDQLGLYPSTIIGKAHEKWKPWIDKWFSQTASGTYRLKEQD